MVLPRAKVDTVCERTQGTNHPNMAKQCRWLPGIAPAAGVSQRHIAPFVGSGACCTTDAMPHGAVVKHHCTHPVLCACCLCGAPLLTQVFGVMKKGGGFPYLIAASTKDGALMWGFRADPHPSAMITQSPTVHNGAVYVGVSSLEELQADDPTYECCTFIGNMLKVDLKSGKVMWRTYMAPSNNNKTGDFSGGQRKR